MTEIKTAIGLMSGTSMDGIDIALLRTDGKTHVERGACLGITYDPAFRARLKQGLEDAKSMTDRRQRPGSLASLERDLTVRHARAVQTFLTRNGLEAGAIDVIGFHGQTVLHRPDAGLTVQIGDGALLARETGIRVMHDMRANDMRHGGQGAPLIPVYHAALARRLGEAAVEWPVVFVNIGGISNLTFIGRDGRIIAFDTGPGNTLIDQWVEAHAGIPYDQGGMIASEGSVLDGLAGGYLSNPFFSAGARRSLDRNDFRPPADGTASLEDGARTLAYVTAAAILRSAEHLPEPAKTYVVCGGGRLNRIIMQDLHTLAARHGATVASAEDVGLDGDAMEAEAWAYLAVRALKALPLTYPQTTGVRQPVTGGVLAGPILLETERLTLSPWTYEDAVQLADLHGTIETSRYVGGGKPWTLDYARTRLEGWMEEYRVQGITKLKLCSRSDGSVIGRAGFSIFERTGILELGYGIRRQDWGKGYATEIARALTRWIFEVRGDERFIAYAYDDNQASINVLRKIGMLDTGIKQLNGKAFRFFEMVRPDLEER